jgi:hypothetical protein
MKDHENHDQHEGQESAVRRHGHESADRPETHGPFWSRLHHDWRFWVAAILELVAISVYVLTGDLSLRPRGQRQQPQQPILAP